VCCESIEVAIAVQEMVSALDTASCDHRINRLTDGDAMPTQNSVILRWQDRDFQSANLYDRQCSKQVLYRLEIADGERS